MRILRIRRFGSGLGLAVALGIACYFAARVAAQPATGKVTAFTFKAAVYFYNGTPQGELGTLSTVARR